MPICGKVGFRVALLRAAPYDVNHQGCSKVVVFRKVDEIDATTKKDFRPTQRRKPANDRLQLSKIKSIDKGPVVPFRIRCDLHKDDAILCSIGAHDEIW